MLTLSIVTDFMYVCRALILVVSFFLPEQHGRVDEHYKDDFVGY